MIGLQDIKNDDELLYAIDWNMTPEEAVRLYLEWGNNWVGGDYVIRSKDDVTHYFVVNTWAAEPVIYFIRRNSDEAVELAEINMPDNLIDRFFEKNGRAKGVFSIEGDVKKWLQTQLYSV